MLYRTFLQWKKAPMAFVPTSLLQVQSAIPKAQTDCLSKGQLPWVMITVPGARLEVEWGTFKTLRTLPFSCSALRHRTLQVRFGWWTVDRNISDPWASPILEQCWTHRASKIRSRLVCRKCLCTVAVAQIVVVCSVFITLSQPPNKSL